VQLENHQTLRKFSVGNTGFSIYSQKGIDIIKAGSQLISALAKYTNKMRRT